MKKLLIVIDYQKDFVSGSLGFPHAADLDGLIAEKIREYHRMGDKGQVIFTMDTHGSDYMETQEGMNLPVPHCIEGEDGWQLYGAVAVEKQEQDLVFRKPTFGSLELAEYLKGREEEYESVEFAGLVSNICVISNMVMVRTAMPQVPLHVEAGCTASNDDDLNEAALKIMESIQVHVAH